MFTLTLTVTCHLQSAPGMVFTLFAGPLTDTYGRKPLIICALLGYFLLDIIFLINSIWFYELKVEYLLLECLQDLTGGGAAFYLASYSLMVDITTPANRTRRLSFLDSFMPIGFVIGLPLGTFIKKTYGYVTLYSMAACVILSCILYVVFVVKEEKKKVKQPEDQTEEDDELKIKLDKSKTSVTASQFSCIFRLLQHRCQDDSRWGQNYLQEER